jgi:hypothetical protein
MTLMVLAAGWWSERAARAVVGAVRGGADQGVIRHQLEGTGDGRLGRTGIGREAHKMPPAFEPYCIWRNVSRMCVDISIVTYPQVMSSTSFSY